jgi:SsrA-binding protein
MHRHEIRKLAQKVAEKGLTLIPLGLHLKEGRVKLQLALAKGKQLHDKRASIKEREDKRSMDRALRGRGD